MPKLDIRIDVQFFSSREVCTLTRLAGREAVACFVQLLTHTRLHGDELGRLKLSDDPAEIVYYEHVASGWNGETGKFFDAIQKSKLATVGLNFIGIIDWQERYGAYAQHDAVNSARSSWASLCKNYGKKSPEAVAAFTLYDRLRNDAADRKTRAVQSQQAALPVAVPVAVPVARPVAVQSHQAAVPSLDHPDQSEIEFGFSLEQLEAGFKQPLPTTKSISQNQKPDPCRSSQCQKPPAPAATKGHSTSLADVLKSIITANGDSPKARPKDWTDEAEWSAAWRVLQKAGYHKSERYQSLKVLKDWCSTTTSDFFYRILAKMTIAAELERKGKLKKEKWHYINSKGDEPSDSAQHAVKKQYEAELDGNGN